MEKAFNKLPGEVSPEVDLASKRQEAIVRNFPHADCSIGLNSKSVAWIPAATAHLPHPMTQNRRQRFVTVVFALMSLLFMQLAMATHVCPGAMAAGAEAQQPDMTASSGMPCAESMTLTMDDEQPSLCAAHCKSDPQTSDKFQLPGLTSLAAMTSDYPLARVRSPPAGVCLQAPLLARISTQSVAVRHCCFRL